MSLKELTACLTQDALDRDVKRQAMKKSARKTLTPEEGKTHKCQCCGNRTKDIMVWFDKFDLSRWEWVWFEAGCFICQKCFTRTLDTLTEDDEEDRMWLAHMVSNEEFAETLICE